MASPTSSSALRLLSSGMLQQSAGSAVGTADAAAAVMLLEGWRLRPLPGPGPWGFPPARLPARLPAPPLHLQIPAFNECARAISKLAHWSRCAHLALPAPQRLNWERQAATSGEQAGWPASFRGLLQSVILEGESHPRLRRKRLAECCHPLLNQPAPNSNDKGKALGWVGEKIMQGPARLLDGAPRPRPRSPAIAHFTALFLRSRICCPSHDLQNPASGSRSQLGKPVRSPHLTQSSVREPQPFQWPLSP